MKIQRRDKHSVYQVCGQAVRHFPPKLSATCQPYTQEHTYPHIRIFPKGRTSHSIHPSNAAPPIHNYKHRTHTLLLPHVSQSHDTYEPTNATCSKSGQHAPRCIHLENPTIIICLSECVRTYIHHSNYALATRTKSTISHSQRTDTNIQEKKKTKKMKTMKTTGKEKRFN